MPQNKKHPLTKLKIIASYGKRRSNNESKMLAQDVNIILLQKINQRDKTTTINTYALLEIAVYTLLQDLVNQFYTVCYTLSTATERFLSYSLMSLFCQVLQPLLQHDP